MDSEPITNAGIIAAFERVCEENDALLQDIISQSEITSPEYHLVLALPTDSDGDARPPPTLDMVERMVTQPVVDFLGLWHLPAHPAIVPLTVDLFKV